MPTINNKLEGSRTNSGCDITAQADKSMRNICNLMTFVLMIFFSGNAYTENRSTHYKAAKIFYKSTNAVDSEALLNQIVTSMVSASPDRELEPYKDILMDAMTEIIQSQEYEDIKIQSYMTHLSEPELNELTVLFSSQAYAKFRKNQVQILKESNEGMLDLLNKKQDMIQKRMKARARGEE
ncbi:MAG: hypothetical protein KBT88_01105 [Gammaproteobacteria bacterium]|nr:hypothetical protein [Gammaproteobacteria bacterium]MBQ0838352.1 hypothetical protein [Gammaproteobacteria bacterium]